MTEEEVSKKYQIPMELLEKYESWNLCDKKKETPWKYDDFDLECLGMIMTLYEVGFTDREVEQYMRLCRKGEQTEEERIRMLTKKRQETLQKIHLQEKQLESLDYLRYQTRKGEEIYHESK